MLPVSRLRHSLTLNISEAVRDTVSNNVLIKVTLVYHVKDIAGAPYRTVQA